MIVKYTYKPVGVCSQQMDFEIDDQTNKIVSLKVARGCNGNLKGISKLVENRSVEEVISLLENIECGTKHTSCPDQIAQGLKQFLFTKN